jgi:hypothetical protein
VLGLVGNEVDEAMVTDCAQNDGVSRLLYESKDVPYGVGWLKFESFVKSLDLNESFLDDEADSTPASGGI